MAADEVAEGLDSNVTGEQYERGSDELLRTPFGTVRGGALAGQQPEHN